jgi:hypothetical protein
MSLPLPSITPSITPSTTPVYKIYIVESILSDGTFVNHTIDIGNYTFPHILHELHALYSKYGGKGYVFSPETLVERMQSMDNVICWFGNRHGIKYVCYVSNPFSVSGR